MAVIIYEIKHQAGRAVTTPPVSTATLAGREIVTITATSTSTDIHMIVETPTGIATEWNSTSTQPTNGAEAIDTPNLQLSTGSIIGIAVGSTAVLVLLVTCLLFSFGFRIRRAKRRDDAEVIERKQDQCAAGGTFSTQNGKAELEDAGYTMGLKRLHNGAKPELEGCKPQKAELGAFSILPVTKRGSPPSVAECRASAANQGHHELPAWNSF